MWQKVRRMTAAFLSFTVSFKGRTVAKHIQTLLLEAITAEGTPWPVIVEHIRADRQIGNWLTVRNHLQGLINAGMVARTPDIRNETYVLTQGEVA